MAVVDGRGGAFELRELLRDELAARLDPAGWHRVDGLGDDSMKLACFTCPLGDEFAATVEYWRVMSVPDRLPVRVSQAMIGVSFEPLRRLWPLLEDQPRVTTVYQGIEEMPERVRCARIEVHTHDEIAPVADQLAGIALEHAVAFAEPHASVDAILGALGYGEAGPVNMVVPALLAAAGRVEQAREALARYGGEMDLPEQKRRERRFVYQLTRWLDSGRDPSLLPSDPPPRRHKRAGSRAARNIWGEARARKAAVDTVKRDGAGRDRSELRRMLVAEFAQRGVPVDPLDIEQQINQFTTSAAERTRRQVEGLKILGKLGLTVAKAIRKQELPELPDLSIPEWLEPPAPAVYTFPESQEPGHRWTAAQLDPDSHEWLAQAHAVVPRLIKSMNTANFEAWVTWGQTPARGVLEVHIGERRVGLLDNGAAIAYWDVMDAAAQRAELPCVEARLTHISAEATYLLEVALPAPHRETLESAVSQLQPD